MYSSERLNLQEEMNHSFISEEQLRKSFLKAVAAYLTQESEKENWMKEKLLSNSLSLSEKKKKICLLSVCQSILLEVFWAVHRYCLLGVNSSQTLRCCLNVYFNPKIKKPQISTRPLNLSQDVQILPTKSHLVRTPNKQLFLSHHALKTVDKYLW